MAHQSSDLSEVAALAGARAKLSAIVLSKNAAHVLGPCLDSLAFADERLVLDSGSTDGSIELAESLGARVVVEPQWRGFGLQRQYAQSLASHEWILWIDSDEVVSPELRASIEAVLANPDPHYAWQANRISDFFGRYIRHGGWYPDWVVRLHHRKHYSYNAAMVHEAIEVPAGHLRSLSGDLQHRTSERLDDYLNKSIGYALAWANERHARGKRVTVIGVLLRPLWTFIRSYLLRCGFLDGRHGLMLAAQSAHYTFAKYFSLWALAQRHKASKKR